MEKLLPKDKYMLALAALIAIVCFVIYTYELSIFRYFRSSYDFDSQRVIERTKIVLVVLSVCLAFQSYRTRFRILIVEIVMLFLFHLMKRWIFSFLKSLSKDNGYLVIFSMLGLYVTAYTLVESKATIDSTNLTAKESNFIALVSAGNSLSFKYAMSLLPELYSQKVVTQPDFFNPVGWLSRDDFATHNELNKWMDSYLSSCTIEKCGNKEYRIDVSGLELSGLMFGVVDFRNSNFNNVYFYNNQVYGCNFSNSNMNELRVRDSNINPNGEGGNYGGEPSLFVGVSMRGAEIIGSDLSGSDFESSDMRPTHQESRRNTKIERSVLRNTSFKNANLENAQFVDVDIRGADFGGANLHGATFNDVLYDEFTQFPEDFDLNRVKSR